MPSLGEQFKCSNIIWKKQAILCPVLDSKHSLQSLWPKATPAFAPAADEARSGESLILWQTRCLWLVSFNLMKSLDAPTIPFRVLVQGHIHNRVSTVTSVLCSQCISGYNIYFLSFSHHSGFLTCTDLPIVDLAHPVVALAERTIVFTGFCHLADADSTFASASPTAQLPPWDAAPELRLGPGQPARRRTTQTAPAEDSKQNKL